MQKDNKVTLLRKILESHEHIKINKYTNWYISLIGNKFGEDVSWSGKEKSKKDGLYFEYHHSLPKSIFSEYAKDKSFIVRLTAREHFVAHLMLNRMFSNISKSKMCCAIYMMTKMQSPTQNRYSNSIFYEQIKSEMNIHKKQVKIGYKHSDQTKLKISIGNLGKTMSEESKVKMRGPRLSIKGRKQIQKDIDFRTSRNNKPCIVNNIEFDSVKNAFKYCKEQFNCTHWKFYQLLDNDSLSICFPLTKLEETILLVFK